MSGLNKEWEKALSGEFSKEYYSALFSFVNNEYKTKTIYPPKNEVFAAFNHTPLSEVKAVIVGQDPYHGPGQAEGLCFSVKKGIAIPPSLVNIYKELHDDIGCDIPNHGSLTSWADQGVLLLNSLLTVRAHNAMSHSGHGWEEFTDAVIDILNKEDRPIVFILWGSPAQKKARKLNNPKHLILKSPHPSPLSAYRGFFGSKPFSKANEFLISNGVEPIDWSIS
ncbi:MAG: uracil-DNA glycosylase [Eubacterium sp.]|nr:uracil-DNA glycosylase [Eubacterium sp.]